MGRVKQSNKIKGANFAVWRKKQKDKKARRQNKKSKPKEANQQTSSSITTTFLQIKAAAVKKYKLLLQYLAILKFLVIVFGRKFLKTTLRRFFLKAAGIPNGFDKPSPTPKKLDGRRIMSCKSLIRAMQRISQHSNYCKNVDLHGFDERTKGIETELTFRCTCGWEVVLKSNGDEDEWDINEGLAWGCANAPMGYYDLSTLLACINVPQPTWKPFKEQQDRIGVKLKMVTKKSMKDAAIEERRLAILDGDFKMINGKCIAMIEVIVDGSWATRCYRSGYRSNYGAAAIIGVRTRKVLFVGIRQRYCVKCTRHRRKCKKEGKDPKAEPLEHNCPLNWKDSATSMEPDIIKEGFQASISEYSLIYKTFIGDGDASVHSAVEDIYNQDVPGLQVKKIECTNHVMRSMRNKLGLITAKNTKYKLSDRQIPGILPSITKFENLTRQILLHYHQLQDYENDHKLLAEDLRNVPFHYYGNHKNCKDIYCNKVGTETPFFQKVRDTTIFQDVKNALTRPALNAKSLIEMRTSNAVESFMSSIAKFLEGKRKNMGGGHLYAMRICAAVLSYNQTTFFSSYAYEILNGKAPNDFLKKMEHESQRRRRYGSKNKSKKLHFLETEDFYYGSDPVTPPISEEDMTTRRNTLHQDLQNDTVEARRAEIEKSTKAQAQSTLWTELRKDRITASKCGRPYRLKDITNNTPTINEILGRRPPSGPGIDFGLEHEKYAVEKYIAKHKLKAEDVEESGLVISPEDGIFAASPDRLVGKDGILEVKCIYRHRYLDPSELPKQKDYSSALKIKDGKIVINQKHNHFYQIVMQLHATQRDWCDYVLYTLKGIVVYRVERADTLEIWEDMKRKLKRFWWEDLAPEIIDPRYFFERKCRLPTYRIKAMEEHEKMKKEKKEKDEAKKLEREKLKVASDNIKNSRRRKGNCKSKNAPQAGKTSTFRAISTPEGKQLPVQQPLSELPTVLVPESGKQTAKRKRNNKKNDLPQDENIPRAEMASTSRAISTPEGKQLPVQQPLSELPTVLVPESGKQTAKRKRNNKKNDLPQDENIPRAEMASTSRAISTPEGKQLPVQQPLSELPTVLVPKSGKQTAKRKRNNKKNDLPQDENIFRAEMASNSRIPSIPKECKLTIRRPLLQLPNENDANQFDTKLPKKKKSSLINQEFVPKRAKKTKENILPQDENFGTFLSLTPLSSRTTSTPKEGELPSFRLFM